MQQRLILWVLLGSAMSGCGQPPPGLDAGVDAGVGLDASIMDAGADSGALARGACQELGLPSVSFDAAARGTRWDEVAGDFTVQTLEGPWTLSESWSGCESYVFIAYAANDYGRGIWASPPDALFSEGANRNVHYFFTTWEATEPEAVRRVEEMRANVEETFAFLGLDESQREWWREHVHYVTTGVRSIVGSVGDLVRASPIILNSFAVTRQQRLDPVGSLSVFRASGIRPDLGMARYAAPYYDYLAALDARAVTETDATVVDLVRHEATTARTLDLDASLPDAGLMASFDTLEIDVEVTCTLRPDECSEWDRIAYVFLCDDPECETRRELVRWITPYSRPGRRRWWMDASPFLGLLADGGDHRFRVVFGPSWERATEREVSVSLRLSSRGASDRSFDARLAFRGGTFDAAYNDGRAPFRFTPPPGTRRVELAVIVSGHGQDGMTNCAEWCDHQHRFTVGGARVATIAFPGEAGRVNGCADRAGEGVVPGQWGNWAPLRAGWCPGFPVPTRRFDITDAIVVGAENELVYEGAYMGFSGGGGQIDMSAYVIFYR